MWDVFVPKFRQIYSLGSHTLTLHRWGWNLTWRVELSHFSRLVDIRSISSLHISPQSVKMSPQRYETKSKSTSKYSKYRRLPCGNHVFSVSNYRSINGVNAQPFIVVLTNVRVQWPVYLSYRLYTLHGDAKHRATDHWELKTVPL